MKRRIAIPVESWHADASLYDQPPPILPEGFSIAERPALRLHEIDLYVTMRCNIRCTFCSVRAGEYHHDDLPLDRIMRLIDEAADLGLEQLHFLGGEPMIRRDLEDMIAHATGRGLHTRVITNGMLVSRERLQRLVDHGLEEVMVSVDGMEETHNRLRLAGPDGWRTTMACIEDAMAVGLRTRASAVAYQDNVDELVNLMLHVERMGVDIFSVFLGSPLGRGHTIIDQVLTPVEWRRLQEQVAQAASALRPDFVVVMEQGFAWSDGPPVDRTQLKGRGTGCNTLLEDLDYLIVRSDGNVYQCVFFMTDGTPIGTVKDQPLHEVLYYALDRADYRPFTVANDKCTSCFHQSECGTGCRGYAHLYTGDWLRTDPRCSKAEPTIEEAPAYFPLCPIMKLNVRSGLLGGSSEQAIERSIPVA